MYLIPTRPILSFIIEGLHTRRNYIYNRCSNPCPYHYHDSKTNIFFWARGFQVKIDIIFFIKNCDICSNLKGENSKSALFESELEVQTLEEQINMIPALSSFGVRSKLVRIFHPIEALHLVSTFDCFLYYKNIQVCRKSYWLLVNKLNRFLEFFGVYHHYRALGWCQKVNIHWYAVDRL